VPRGSKLIRALPTARAARQLRVRVPREGGQEWLPKFLKQVREFTGKPGRRDNMVDGLTQLYDQAQMQLGIAQAGATSGGESIMANATF
jgi:hypothetical protein